MKHICLLIALIFCFALQTNAQMGWGKPEDIAALKRKRLTVFLAADKTEDVKKVAKLKKKNKLKELKEYRASLVKQNEEIKKSNENLKELFPKYWTITAFYDFAIRGQKKAEFSLDLSAFKFSTSNNIAAQPMPGISVGVGSGFNNKHGALGLMRSGKMMAEVLLPNQPNKVDIIYGLRLLQQYLNHRAKKGKMNSMSRVPFANFAESNKHLLKGKILLIDRQYLSDKVKPESIKDYYPYKYEVVDSKRIEEIVLANDKRYAYIQHAPYKGNATSVTGASSPILIPAQHIVNVEDGKLLGYSKLKGVQKVSKEGLKMIIKPANLKQYARQAKK